MNSGRLAYPLREPRLSLVSCILVATGMHLITAVLGITMALQAESVATLWLPDAIAISILLTRRRADWPWVMGAVGIAGLAVNLAMGSPLPRCLAYVTGDLCEVLVGSELLRRYCRIERSLDSVGELVRVQLLGGVVPALVGATVATPLLLSTGFDGATLLWFSWLEASAIGSVAVLPLGVLLAVRGWPDLRASLLTTNAALAIVMSVALTAWARQNLPQPYVYVIVGLVAAALVGRFPAAAMAVMLNATVLLMPLSGGHPGGEVAVADPYARALLVLPVELTLVLPLLLAVTLERIRQQVANLAAREEEARLLYQKTPVMMYTLDRNRHVVEVSDAWLERMGYRRDQVVGRPSSDFMTQESRAIAERVVAPRFQREGVIRDAAYQLFTSEGEIVDVTVSAIGERDGGGRFVRAMAVFQDVSEQRRLAGELARQQERIAVTLHSIGDGVVTADEHGRISYLNPVAEKLLGWTSQEAAGRRFGEVVTLVEESGKPLLDPEAHCLHDARAAGMSLSAVMRDRGGHEYAVEDSVAPIKSPDGKVLGSVMVFQDVTEKREISQRMSRLALHDPLTDLPNRLLFQDRVQQLCQFARREGKNFAVMFMDLDHFKRVNDSLGHAVGDELLKTVARRLRESLRDSDTVCRLGGDEFVTLLADIDGVDGAGEVARKILGRMAEASVLEGTDVRIGVSIGFAMFPEHGVDPATLMKRADAAMYRSKRDGRNRFAVWSREMDEPAAARLQLEADMRRGLAQGEFLVHYQPVVSAGTMAPVGVEALARWSRGGKDMELPETFIPIAEDSGLIIEMGAQVLRQACAQLGVWAGGPLGHLRIAVNVSALQLSDPGFVATVADALRAAGVPGHLLEIEMTESTLSKDPELALQVLSQLKRLGVRIAIDDFGTGYSSLSNLRQFPLDIVKIDRSFVADLETDPDDRELVNAILAMSRSLRLDVVAEGVERDSQAAILQSMKCQSLQGFLFSVPSDAERTTAWLSRRDAAARAAASPQASLFH